MKYPFIIFYRNELDADCDKFFIDNNKKLNCTVHITNKVSTLNKIYSANYHLLITRIYEQTQFINYFSFKMKQILQMK